MAAYEPSTWPLRENVAKRCLAVGVVLAAGNVFSVSQSAAPPMRFNVAQSGNQRLEEAHNQALDRGSVEPGRKSEALLAFGTVGNIRPVVPHRRGSADRGLS